MPWYALAGEALDPELQSPFQPPSVFKQLYPGKAWLLDLGTNKYATSIGAVQIFLRKTMLKHPASFQIGLSSATQRMVCSLTQSTPGKPPISIMHNTGALYQATLHPSCTSTTTQCLRTFLHLGNRSIFSCRCTGQV